MIGVPAAMYRNRREVKDKIPGDQDEPMLSLVYSGASLGGEEKRRMVVDSCGRGCDIAASTPQFCCSSDAAAWELQPTSR
uniref:Uncharacterized protein n=1 Tax=Arundo donax TaxID=35708 RepID=A0A0A9BAS4_ARUDO